jgi:hypothetical protein
MKKFHVMVGMVACIVVCGYFHANADEWCQARRGAAASGSQKTNSAMATKWEWQIHVLGGGLGAIENPYVNRDYRENKNRITGSGFRVKEDEHDDEGMFRFGAMVELRVFPHENFGIGAGFQGTWIEPSTIYYGKSTDSGYPAKYSIESNALDFNATLYLRLSPHRRFHLVFGGGVNLYLLSMETTREVEQGYAPASYDFTPFNEERYTESVTGFHGLGEMNFDLTEAVSLKTGLCIHGGGTPEGSFSGAYVYLGIFIHTRSLMN